MFVNCPDSFGYGGECLHACTLLIELMRSCGSCAVQCAAGSEKGRVPGAISASLVNRSSNKFRSSYLGVQVQLMPKSWHSTRNSTAVGGSARAEIYIENEIYVEEAESTAVPTTQKGWTYSEFGPKEVLKFEDIPVPEVKPDEVLVKVQAAALNPVDSKRRMGKFKNTDSELPVGSILPVG